MIALYGYQCDLRHPLTVFTAAWRGAHGPEFCDPLLESVAVCCCCGIEASDDVRIFSALMGFERDGHWAGVGVFFHCVDCPPETILEKLTAKPCWPAETDEWKFTQGKLGPNENPR